MDCLSDQTFLQRFVLGEMIKASSIDVQLLVEFIKNNNVEQNWMHMQLPVGKWSHAAASSFWCE